MLVNKVWMVLKCRREFLHLSLVTPPLALMEDNLGSGSKDSIIPTFLEIYFTVTGLDPKLSRPVTNICGLKDWVNYLWRTGLEPVNFISGLTWDSSEASSATRTCVQVICQRDTLRNIGTSVGEVRWGEIEAKQKSDFQLSPNFCQIP